MGLDVYVGPLTQYYGGAWETKLQQVAEAAGLEVRVSRPRRSRRPDPGVSELRDKVLQWRSELERSAAGKVPHLEWDESISTEYHTDQLGWDGYWAVWFLAANDEFPDARFAKAFPAPMDDPERDPLHRRVQDACFGRSGIRGLLRRRGTGTRYGQIFFPEMWLPVPFDQVLPAKGMDGDRMIVGSAPALLRELELLNSRTLQGDELALQRWRRAGPPEDDEPEEVARFGLSVLLAAAVIATRRRVPMKLDY